MFVFKSQINQLPKTSGVYCFKNHKQILYIGKALNIQERVKTHLYKPNHRDSLFLNKIKKIGYIKTESEIEALLLEAKLIKKYQPKYNIVWKDDKNYFFVGISQDDFPRVFITHQTKIKTKDSNEKITYIGPFVNGRALKQTLKILRRAFPYRSCKNLPSKPCLWYHLKECPGPCLLKTENNKLSNETKKEIKKSSQKNTENLISILKGEKEYLLRELKEEMKRLAKELNFEKAAVIRDQIIFLEKVLKQTKIIKESPSLPLNYENAERHLRKLLKIRHRISKIEAYDVSNIQGKIATGSMVAFVNGKPNKNLYRRFKIKFIKKPNDVAMIKEIVLRRLNHKEWRYPKLFLIDGGKAQLNAAIDIKNKMSEAKNIKVISLAKKENKMFIEGKRNPLLLEKLPQEVFSLILQLRDESHRFAIGYHRKLREKALLK